MQVVGFANEYYTLWHVSEPYREYVGEHSFYMKVDKTFIRNLSKNYEEALAKVEGEYRVDLELKGTSHTWTSKLEKDYDLWRFTYGKLEGDDMRECNDVWQLTRAMNSELNPRRRVWARRRLLELGELVRYTWTEYVNLNVNWGKRDGNGNCLPDDYQDVPHVRRYASPRLIAAIEQKKQISALQTGHFFNNGERVTLQLTLQKEVNFSSTFGTVYIQTFSDTQNRKIHYKGSAPLDLKVGESAIVVGTVEHGEYKGELQTRIKRVKITNQPKFELC